MEYRPTTLESGRRWTDTFMVPLIIILTVLIPITWPIYQVRRFYGLKFRGFWVTRVGRDPIEYQELHNGKIERLTIAGEMMSVGQHIIYLPTEEEWQQTMPNWAKGRRKEIIRNVKHGLGTKHYEYDLS